MISVIVCTYNRCESLRQTLLSLRDMNTPAVGQWELIVVDNNSTDGTSALLKEWTASGGLPLRVLFEAQPGLSFARNTGIRTAKGDVLVFTDDDVVVEKDWLAKIAEAFQEFGCIAIGGRICPVWPGPKPSWFRDSGPFRSPTAIVYYDYGDRVCVPESSPFGANMAFRREAFEKYGDFRLDLGRVGDTLTGGEDMEFFERLKRAGEKILYIPEAVVYHPVTQDRLKKKYLEKWCFNAARSAVRSEGVPKQAVYYFGVPRYYLRALLADLCRYCFTFDSDRRFHHKLQICRVLGGIAESRRMVKLLKNTTGA